MSKKRIKIIKDGPYEVTGNVPLQRQIIVGDGNGISERWKDGEKFPKSEHYHLCRCGKSKSKPYCDKTHMTAGVDCTETAEFENFFDKAEVLDGPDAVMYDESKICASGRFCDRGDTAWNLVGESSDPDSKKMLIEECCDCPSGRLVVRDKKTGKIIEPKLEKSIGIIEDPDMKISGPLWVKGEIPVESANGETYEVRNRVTLCRCGKSKNKPFCDRSHIEFGFNDGDSSLK
ncbi:MAG: CDGSH iron-sulfur domain-containing protein [Patescibacteria group bacterium]|jgi:CDGSH-type Zn-finger protein